MTAVKVRAKQPGYYDGYRKAGDEFMLLQPHFLKDPDTWMELVEAPEAAPATTAAPVDEFENMSVADLKQYAQDKLIDVSAAKKKPEFLATIRAAVAAAAEAKAAEEAAKAEAEAAEAQAQAQAAADAAAAALS